MRTWKLAAIASASILAVGTSVAALMTAQAAQTGGVLHATANAKSVVVELFTSEGCSSCPSADAVLSNLVDQQPISGVKVIALGEHVDYWNRLGWRDPFSDVAFTNRQGEYARSFRNDQVYTPQMVVQGQSEFVGSDDARARAEINRATNNTSSFLPLSITVQPSAGGKLDVSVSAPANAKGAKDATIYYAVTQDGLASDVARGENAGRRLTHVAVVRQMDQLAAYKVASGVENATKTISIRAGESRAHLHVVVFAQRPSTGAILSAAEVDLKDLGSATVATRR